MECEHKFFHWPLAAPGLANVVLYNVIQVHHLRSSMPSFGPITSLALSLRYITTEESYTSLRDALMALISLTHLELQILAFFRSPSTLPITLPGLQILEVDVRRCTCKDGKDGKNIINSIHATSLISLALKWNDSDADLTGSTSDESRIPSLRHLLLFGPTVFSELDWLARMFPNIERLTCWAGADVHVILAAIGEGADDGSDGGPEVSDGLRWPKLHSIGALGIDPKIPFESFNLVVLRDAISKLQECGRPFHTLWCLQSSFARANESDMAELREIIHVADFSDDWPLPFNFQ